MWKTVTLSTVLLLSSCQLVTIDEIAEQQETESANKRELEQPVVEEREATKQETFLELPSTESTLQWAKQKNDDARTLYYLALGDSLTRGIGDEYNLYGYSDRLATAIELWPAITKVELDNRGKNGRQSEKVLELLRRGHYDEELRKADLITMTIGGNDVMKVVKSDFFALKKEMFDVAKSQFAERYSQIVQEIRLRNADAPIILIGFYNPFSIITDEFTPFELIINEWNEEMKQVADTNMNACFVPIDDLFISNTDLVYHTDFFHPSTKGYERMTERIIDTMVQCNIESMSDGLIGFEEGKNE